MRTTDLRGALLPVDGLTHISRINNWEGSDSYAEGCPSQAPEDKPIMPDSERLPYMLIAKAFHDGRLYYPGQIVYVHPEHVADHHAKIKDVEYPDDPPKPEKSPEEPTE